MKITTTLAVAFACATLAACSGGGETNNLDNLDSNMMMTDNMATDMNMDMNATDLNMDMNATDINIDTNATGNTTDINTTTNTL